MKRVPLSKPLASDTLRQLRDFWLDARNDSKLPARRDIDPIKMPNLLPYITLIDVFYDPLRFRYRLIGTATTELAGRDPTGKCLDEELYGDKAETVNWPLRTCVDSLEPIAIRETVQFVDKNWIVVEELFLPLGKSDDTVDIVLVGVKAVDTEVEPPPPDTKYILDWTLGEQGG
jgi:hypothetical protein